MAILFIITHELVTLEQIISKRNYSHLYNNGIATSELTIDHHFWSQFAFLHGGVDGGGGMDLGGRKRRAGEEGETDSERVRDKRRTGATSAEPGGGMEVDSQSSAEALPDSASGRGRQERVHLDGVSGGVHHSRGACTTGRRRAQQRAAT